MLSFQHASLSLQGQTDRSIMEVASQLYNDSTSLTSINMVRMAHNIYDLSYYI